MSGEPVDPQDAAAAWPMLKEAVGAIIGRSDEAREAYEAMRARGVAEVDAKEEIARVLLAVMFHVGAESERVRAAGGGAGLRSEAFRRLAAGETAADVFEGE